MEPGKIDIDIIDLIHRGRDGSIVFARKLNNPVIMNGNTKNFENLGSILVDELKSVFPKFKIWLFADSYFSINTAYAHAFWNNRKTGLPDVSRKEKNLRYLNACYCDLDVGRPKSKIKEQRLTYPAAIYQVSILTEIGKIPPPSIIARSGRGAYLWWLLFDNINPSIPPRAWPEKIVLYKKINKELGSRLEALAWDRNAYDAARVLRVPGSYHTTAKQIVYYTVQLDKMGKPFFYTLNELAEFCGLKILENPIDKIKDLEPIFRQTIKKGSTPKRRNGQIMLNIKRAQDLLTLEQYHGGFNHGCRRRRLIIYAEFLRRFIPKDEALQAINIMASNCNPPYPSESNDPPPKTIIENVYSGKKGSVRNWRNDKLCQELRITSQLAQELNLDTIVPPEIEEERKNQLPERELRRRDRQDAVLKILSTHYHASCREISRALKKIYGIDAHYATVSRELPLLRKMILDSRRLNA